MISDVLSLLVYRHAQSVRLRCVVRIVSLYFYSFCLVEGSYGKFFLSEEVLQFAFHLFLHEDRRSVALYELLLLVVINRVAAVDELALRRYRVDILVQFVLLYKLVAQVEVFAIARDVVMAGHNYINLILLRNEVGVELTRFCIRIDSYLIAIVSYAVLVQLAYVRSLEVVERSFASLSRHLVSIVLISKFDANAVGEVVLRKRVTHGERFLLGAAGNTSDVAYGCNVKDFESVVVVLIVAVGAVAVGQLAAVLKRMVGEHCLHLVLSDGHADGELSVSVGLHDVALAVHYGDSVHGERHALYGHVAALVHPLTRDVERRLVGEVHGVALSLRVDEAQLLSRCKLMDAECRHNHVCSSVAGVRQRSNLIRSVYRSVAAMSELSRCRDVFRAGRNARSHTMIHVILSALVRDVVESVVNRIVEGVVSLQTVLVTHEIATVVVSECVGVERLVPQTHLVDGSLEAFAHHHLIVVARNLSRTLGFSHSLTVYIYNKVCSACHG